MKTIKSILIAATLISASVVSTLSAQQAAEPAKTNWNVAVGDSIMIRRDVERYLTGEKPSVWVYDKVHTVRQLGTKRFPNGVLVGGIMSWVGPEGVTPLHPRAAEPEQPQPAQPQEGQPGEVTPVTPAADTTVVTPAEDAKGGETTPADGTEGQSVAPADTTKKDQVVVVEQVKGDSVVSKQQFIHPYDRFTIGVRGGASALLHSVKKGNWNCGYDVMLDLQYAHYWQKDGRPVDLGIITGIGIGYAASGMKASVNTQKTITDSDGDQIDYNVKADEVKENDAQLQVEIPLMFSLLHTNGLFFNAGLRCMLPVYTPYTQKISNNANTYIDAYFPGVGVHVTNKEVTGVLGKDDYTTKGTDNGNKMAFNLMLGAEIGYEWILKSGNSLGLGAYANYSVYSTFKNNNTTEDPLIQVTAPTSTSVAQVKVLSATKTYAEKLGFFDAGVKLAYHFNFPKKRKFSDDKLF